MKARVQLPFVLIFALLICFAAPAASAIECGGSVTDSITIQLPPAIQYLDDGISPDPSLLDDSITIPNGKPIYALMVHGFTQNENFDLLLCYDFVRHLMDNGAYVHYAWWNNLCAPYMARPLHQGDSYPGNRDKGQHSMWDTSVSKAKPTEDYQFLADAKQFLIEIRNNNPNAMIIILGHSMGGGAVVHLASDPEVQDIGIDILAPIDPVDNRQTVSGRLHVVPFQPGQSFSDGMYTRWRITHEEFKGYKPRDIFCAPYGNTWYGFLDPHPISFCIGGWLLNPFVHNPDPLEFRSGIINLFHRWQNEYIFPFDYYNSYWFVHNPIAGGSSDQAAVNTCGFLEWDYILDDWCFGQDGHGEIVGYRGAQGSVFDIETQPYGLQAQNWPIGDHPDSVSRRRELLIEMETASLDWSHRPVHPDLCMVSTDLSILFNTMNKPPQADAGEDQFIDCTSNGLATVTLDGYAYDPDTRDEDKNEVLYFSWEGPFGQVAGQTVSVLLPWGTHTISMYVQDKVGHFDCDQIEVTVGDNTGPELEVVLAPGSLWPPNHKLVAVEAIVSAVDSCEGDVTVELVSVTSSEPDNGRGDGNTTGDIRGADIGTGDRFFQLRAERAGGCGGRVYTVTYRAVDGSGNESISSAEIIVANMPPNAPRGFTVSYQTDSGNQLSWDRCPDPDFQHFAIYSSTDPEFTPDPVNLVHTTTELRWTDPGRDGEGVFYKLSAIDDTGQESPASSPANDAEEPGERPTITLRFAIFGTAGTVSGGNSTVTAVIPGTSVFDVRAIDASTLSLFEESPAAWDYGNVDISMGSAGGECTGLSKGFDAYQDLSVMFDREAVIDMLAERAAAAGDDPEDGFEVTVSITGKLTDGTTLDAKGCARISSDELEDPRPREDSGLPQKYALGTNVPNPFNPLTRIKFALPQASHVRLEIYDLAGRHVSTLISEYVAAGEHYSHWNGKDGSGTNVASGVYLYHIRAGSFVETKRMVLLR